MAGGAAGGFVTRAFESMLKECSNKKYHSLQSAIRVYLDNGKNSNQQPDSAETKKVSSAVSSPSSYESSSGAEKVDMMSDNSTGASSAADSTGSITAILASAGHTLGEAEAELVLNPLRLAFESKNIKVVELALDCLHKLVEYDHLEGDPGLEGGKNSELLTNILKMVCSCADNSAPDSTTLQVLKVLLTAIASTKMRVHREPLLEVIRTCFNIALNSKSPISQATSKAMLTQMLSIIFRPVAADTVSFNYPEAKEVHLEDGLDTMVEVLPSDDNDLANALNNLLFVKQRNSTSLASYGGTKTLFGSTDMKGLEAIFQKAVDVEDGGDFNRVMAPENTVVEQRDALLIFRTLCKMGMKEGNDEATTKTRILSLELLQGLLDDDRCLFMKNIPFIDLMRAHLSRTLIQASASKSPLLFQCATAIFSVLLLRYRESFKAEIGILFPVIALRSLDGSDLTKKLTVLRMLEKVCKDPQMLVDLYVNYDCDLEAPNLFDRMVATLSKIAQGTQNVNPKSSAASQASSIKTSSLQALVNVLKALVIWEKSKQGLANQDSSKGTFEEVSHRESDESKHKGDSPHDFENLKNRDFTIEDIIYEFNQQPGKALQHLISSQMVENTPSSIAQFLRNTPKLDKAMIGDYLGQHDDFPAAVMNAYVESMNYSGMKFEVALDEFLKGLQLPGEAQKIDRLMEKFTERYCAENPGHFKNAHTAYVLAYSIIIMKADAENPIGHSKISKNDFISINTAYSAEDSASQELLEEVYDSVKEQMELKGEAAGSLSNGKQQPEAELGGRLFKILNFSLNKRHSSTGSNAVSETITKQIQALLKKQGGDKWVVFYTTSRIELVCPMVEAVGWPLLAAFAVSMGEVDNAQRISICLEGFKEGICITHVLGMDTMRYAFLTSLLRYNSLHAPKEIRSKNVEALGTLLSLCDTEMYALEGSWSAVLESISRLEYVVSSPAMTANIMQGANQVSRDAVIQSLKELSGKPTEQVFLNSIKLPSESVVEFFSALCSVSAEELKQNPARNYSLQKMVEVIYYNMARIRMVWARIWSVLAQHFILAGSHADENIATYSVDSLRQLGMKHLERDELDSFTFQNDILKPFVVLMRSNRSESMRKLILDSIVQVIRLNVGSIKSGWHSVFMVFTTAANDDQESIVEQAFENVEQVILEHFDQITGVCFMDCVNCLMGFSNNRSSCGISLKAIALLHICADRLAEGHKQGNMPKHDDVIAEETCERYWLPMLAALSDLTSDPRSEVRNCAVEVLFDLLNERGSKFSPSFWENVFQRVLFPIFDRVRHAGEENLSSGEDWYRESCIHALQLLCKLFGTFYKAVSFMLSPLLDLLLDCAKKTDQTIASISLGALEHLIDAGGHQFSDHDWDTLLKSIRDASYTTQPLELLNNLGLEAKHHKVLSRDLETASFKASANGNGNILADNQETERLAETEGSEGMPSPSGRSTKSTDSEGFRRSPTFGQKIIGNMKENLLLRSFTSKPKNRTSDVMLPASPPKVCDTTVDTDERDEEDTPMLRGIRSKCMTQLLLLGVVDGIQQKYWDILSTQNKITVMEILFSVLEFSASYNSYTNLRLRMHQTPAERPPLNLLRQEVSGTCIYLEILLKTTSAANCHKDNTPKEDKIKGIVEEKLVSFCDQVLRAASDFQSSMEETTDMDFHRVLELRSPITVKVLKGMREMNPKIFKNHLNEFYPSLTKLVCCEQMDIRNALADLLNAQLGKLLPQNLG